MAAREPCQDCFFAAVFVSDVDSRIDLLFAIPFVMQLI
jgi:hypothetical protein